MRKKKRTSAILWNILALSVNWLCLKMLCRQKWNWTTLHKPKVQLICNSTPGFLCFLAIKEQSWQDIHNAYTLTKCRWQKFCQVQLLIYMSMQYKLMHFKHNLTGQKRQMSQIRSKIGASTDQTPLYCKTEMQARGSKLISRKKKGDKN